MTDPAPSPTPIPPPHFASGYFRDASVGNPQQQLGRGLVGHVPIVGGLMIALGVLEGLLAMFFVLFALISSLLPPESGANPVMLAIFYAGLAVFTLACGAIRLLAGLSVVRFRRRNLGLAALGIGLLPVFTGLCAPTSIGIAVYGLFVLLNESVIVAFEMASDGKSAAEIQRAFPP
jgi:uncharacterized membrane protein YphA (DoxX/SURF4 family)